MLRTKFIILVIAAVLELNSGLKCHVCKNLQNAHCKNIEEKDNNFLQECPANSTLCVTVIESAEVIIRKCANSEFKCNPMTDMCDTCEENGCNRNNQVQKKEKAVKKNLPSPLLYFIQANSPLIGGGVLIITLGVIYCMYSLCASCRRRRRNQYDEEEEYENDADSTGYYENEV